MTANKVETKISDMDPQISKDVCAICLESATAGQGKSLFVSECSHTFHFDCIAKSVSYANRTCPNCRSTWIHLPSLAPNLPPKDPSYFSDSDSSDTSDSDSSSSSLALDPNNNLFNRLNNYVYPLPARYSSRPSSTPILSSPSPVSARTSTRGGEPHSADRTPLIKMAHNSVLPLPNPSDSSRPNSTPILSSPSPISAPTSTRGGAPHSPDRTPLIKKMAHNSVRPLPTPSDSSRPSSTPILSRPSPISARISTRGGAPHSADRTPLIKKMAHNSVRPLPIPSDSSRPSSTPILCSPSSISARTSTRGGAPRSTDRTPLIKKIGISKGDNKAHNNISYIRRAARECNMPDSCCGFLPFTRPKNPCKGRR